MIKSEPTVQPRLDGARQKSSLIPVALRVGELLLLAAKHTSTLEKSTLGTYF